MDKLTIANFNYPVQTRLNNLLLAIKRVTAGANTWRKIEVVMGYRRISRRLKRNVLSSYVTRAYMTALETMALTQKQQVKVRVCENNLVGIIVGVKRATQRSNNTAYNCHLTKFALWFVFING